MPSSGHAIRSGPATDKLVPNSFMVEAVYEDGVIKPLAPLDLPAGTPISLQVTPRIVAPDGAASNLATTPPRAGPRWGWLRDIGGALAQPAIGARGLPALTYMGHSAAPIWPACL